MKLDDESGREFTKKIFLEWSFTKSKTTKAAFKFN